ncbi:MAG: hypothetical protein I8H87_02050 [Comamonadaceae bacterium]|jgi:hypothetical protein|nr:hypothetical protein [Comamonadaceae bacterium]
MEALILLIDMLVMAYLCWRLFKNRPDSEDLGFLSYKSNPKETSKLSAKIQSGRHA